MKAAIPKAASSKETIIKTVVRDVSHRYSTACVAMYLAGSLKSFVFTIDAQAELDRAVNASRKLRGDIQIEARFQHKRVSRP